MQNEIDWEISCVRDTEAEFCSVTDWKGTKLSFYTTVVYLKNRLSTLNSVCTLLDLHWSLSTHFQYMRRRSPGKWTFIQRVCSTNYDTLWFINTRMHSSRMRTAGCSGRLPGGGVCPQGDVCPGGCIWPAVSVQGVCLARRGCLPRERGCLPGGVWPGDVCQGSLPRVQRECTPPSPRGQTDTYENITFPQLLLQTVIKDHDQMAE